eukprot:TRINITY_DN998_c0_g2_i1.p1 TRINITY_DN998_c0_g2~~TRINITY_DN998_c0_g2_i1.p1  ORF type:complete len:401 (+),score=148.82 TRINITY_DN998_c0_g2_i1:69-1205(+)
MLAPPEKVLAPPEKVLAPPEKVQSTGSTFVWIPDDTKSALAGEIPAKDSKGKLQEFLCTICLTHAFQTAVVTPCGHIFHLTCIKGAVAGATGYRPAKCPNCRELLPAGQPWREAPLCVKRFMDRAEVECPQGCGAELVFEDLERHVSGPGGCPNTTLRCGNKGCEAAFKRADEAQHREQCVHAIVSCAKCGDEVPRSALQRHDAQECPERAVKCPHCGAEGVAFCRMEQHKRECTGPLQVRHAAQLMESLLELRGLVKRQQDQIEKQQEFCSCMGRQLAAMGVPLCVAVRSAERPQLSGLYSLLGERAHGAAVWGRGGDRVLRSKAGYWLVQGEAHGDGGSLGSAASTAHSPADVVQWQCGSDAAGWAAAPGTTVEGR